jgi:hypothetical protein
MVATAHEQGLKHPLKSFHSIGFNAFLSINNPRLAKALPKNARLAVPDAG